jgi:3-oxoadipate enol-lactonase
MPTQRANGIDIRYEVCGAGPWLVLCHGLACDLTLWDAQVEPLARHFTVLRYDLRGHGGSSVPDGPYAMDTMVNDALGLLDALNVATCHFVGLSMGGMIAQHFALTAPHRLDRLALCATTSGFGAAMLPTWDQRIGLARAQGMSPLVESTLQRWFTEPYRFENAALMQKVGDTIRNTAVEGYAACGRMIAEVDTTAKLSRIVAPTLVLGGDEDPGTTPAMVEDLAAAIPGARLEMLPQAAHLLNIEQAQLFNALLLEFLRSA